MNTKTNENLVCTRAQRSPNPILRLKLMFDIARQRYLLSKLQDHELRDIGITRADAELESRRKFWDID